MEQKLVDERNMKTMNKAFKERYSQVLVSQSKK